MKKPARATRQLRGAKPGASYFLTVARRADREADAARGAGRHTSSSDCRVARTSLSRDERCAARVGHTARFGAGRSRRRTAAYDEAFGSRPRGEVGGGPRRMTRPMADRGWRLDEVETVARDEADSRPWRADCARHSARDVALDRCPG